MRASRLLTIQMLLESRGRMSARELAQKLEVSERTLYRDVDELAAAGVPVFAERGRNGGFRLVEGWKTTLTGFTALEAQAVFMSGLAEPATQLGLGQHVTGAQLKLVNALPAHQRTDAQRIQSRFHLDAVDWYREGESVPHLATAAAAVWQDLQLVIHYESWQRSAQRTVNPLGLVLKAGTWYLVAAREGKPLTYRISNIHSAQLQTTATIRPAGFDLAAYWADSLRRFETQLYKTHAVVLASARGLKDLRKLSAAVARSLASVQPTRGGKVRVEIPIESVEHATGQLLHLAPDVEVLAPRTLKRALVRKLDEINRCYRAAR